MLPPNKFEKHPVDVLKSRKTRLTRIHALEIARRALSQGGEGEGMMPLTAEEMPNPMQQMQTADPTAQWPGMMSGGMPSQSPFGEE